MDNVTLTADSTPQKDSSIEHGEADSPTRNYKDRRDYHSTELESLNSIIAQKDRDIQFWRTKAQNENELHDTISGLQQKLHQAINEAKVLKESQASLKSQYQNKYIEKTQHNREMSDLQAKVNYLTSENERLNKLISDKLNDLKTRGDEKLNAKGLEDTNHDLVSKLENLERENEKLQQIVQKNTKEIEEWKNKHARLETENNKLKAHARENMEEIENLKGTNEEKERKITALKDVEEKIKEVKAENEKINRELEDKKKELREARASFSSLEKKEAEFLCLKERFEMTVKENEELHLAIVGKDCEIDEWKARYEELGKASETIKELEKRITKLGIEKDELTIKYQGRSDALRKLKEVNLKLYNEYNELKARLEYVEQENTEFRQVAEGYAKMIEDLKNTVVKGDKGPHKMLNFEGENL